MPEDNERVPFPTHLLPPKVRAMAEAVEAYTTTGHDMPGVIGASALNCAIGGGVYVTTKDGSQVTPTTTFTVVVGVSGGGKSLVGKLLLEAIEIDQQRRQEEFRRDSLPVMRARIMEIDDELKRLEREGSRPRKGQADDPDARRNRRTELLGLKDQLEFALDCPQMISEDLTVQVMVRILNANKSRLILLSTDARETINNIMGRYNNGKPDDSLLLKAFSGESYNFSRRGQGKVIESLNVNKMAVSSLLMLQPDIAEEMVESEGLQGSGYLQRTLFAWTDNHPGRATLSKPIPREVKEAYDQLITTLLRTYYWSDPRVYFTLSTEAEEAIKAYKEAKQIEGGDGSHPMWTFQTRDAELVIRIAAGQHAGLHEDKSHEVEISLETIRAAMQIMDWYSRFRMMIADKMADKGGDKVMSKLRDLATLFPNGFSCRDAQRKRIAGMHKDAAAVQAILELKLKNGLLQLVGDGPPRYKFALR
jgi:hypothetical protein